MRSEEGAWLASDGMPGTDDPLWSRGVLPLREDLSVLGHALTIRTNAPALAALAREAFGRFGAPEIGRATLDLALVLGNSEDENQDSDQPIHRERGGLFVASDGQGSLVTADLAAGKAKAFISAGARPEGVRAVLLEATAYRFVTWHGQTAMHAGAVVIGGQTLVLRGGGGAGKSTLAYAAARAGYAVLADEVVWWDPTSDCLRGTPWWLRLEDDAARLFPELASVPLTPRAQGKPKRVAEAHALGLTATDRAPAGPLVLLDRQTPRPARSTWERMPTDAARAAFIATMIPGEHAQPADRLAQAIDILLMRGAFRLVAGQPDDAVAALAAIARAARMATKE